MTGTSAKMPVGTPVTGFVGEDVPLTFTPTAPRLLNVAVTATALPARSDADPCDGYGRALIPTRPAFDRRPVLPETLMALRGRAILALILLLSPFGPAAGRYRHHGHHRTHHVPAYAFGGYGGGYYTAVSGHQVHRPMRSGSRPAGATARCRDDSWSFSESHRGTCSHHGGVAIWL